MVIKVAVSYSGGKDSNLVLFKMKQDPQYDVVILVTFIPAQKSPFLAHNLELIRLQAKALSIPHKIVQINEIPSYLESYQHGIKELNKEYNIKYLVTGDVLPVCSDFMERAVDGTGAELLRPLWGLDSEVILDELFEAKFQVYITCINKTKIKDGEKWIGKLLSYELLKESDSGLNLLGEFGEYHTMCVYSPLYTIDFRTLVKQNSKLNLPSNEYMLDKSIVISTNIKSSSCNNFYYWEF